MNMIEKRKAMAGQGGFTLIELLVVIAILAVLGGAAIIGIGALRGNAQSEVCDTDKETIELAAEAWALDQATVPASITVDDLVQDGYLKKQPENYAATDVVSFGGTNSAASLAAAAVTACKA
jgi:prepilin-type N-terminal cleavage/methylation domain-containing protein